MVDDIYTKLNEGIGKHLDELAGFDVGSAEMSKAIDDVAVLYKLRIEEEKLELERGRAAAEKTDKDNRSVFDKKKLILDTAVAGAELIFPLALYGVHIVHLDRQILRMRGL